MSSRQGSDHGRQRQLRVRFVNYATDKWRARKTNAKRKSNSTTNLSTWSHLNNQSMIPESGIMERLNQRHVSRLCRPPPPPPPHSTAWPAQRADFFFLVAPFLPFPHCGAWSQARSSRFPHTRDTKAANSKDFTSNCVTIKLKVRAWTRLWSRYYMKRASPKPPFLYRDW